MRYLVSAIALAGAAFAMAPVRASSLLDYVGECVPFARAASGIQKILVNKAMDIFYDVRDVPGLKKKPSTSELLDWLKLLLHEDMPLEVLQNRDPTKAIPPLHGALLKNEQDVMLFERLAFMAKRQANKA